MDALEIAQLIEGDCLLVLPEVGAETTDAVMTDPPYGIAYGTHKWDDPRAIVPGGRRRKLRPGPAYQMFCEAWMRECIRIMSPGGILCSFSATRMMHRSAAAARRVGFVDLQVFGWCYQTGVPMSIHVEKVLAARIGPDRAARFRDHCTALKTAWEAILVARKPS